MQDSRLLHAWLWGAKKPRSQIFNRLSLIRFWSGKWLYLEGHVTMLLVCKVPRSLGPETQIISRPVDRQTVWGPVWANCLIDAVASSTFRSFHSATQFSQNLTTTPCLQPQNRLCFLAPCISSCTCQTCCPDSLFSESLRLTLDFCAVQQRPVEPRRCDLSGDAVHKTKQANQSTVSVSEVRAPSLRHLAPRPSRSGERHERKEPAHTPSFCGAKSAQSR